MPLREHLKIVERSTGERPPELDVPPLPAGLRHVWQWFCDLHAARGSGGMGPSAITWGEIAAWASLTRARPSPVEVDIIRALDRAFLEVENSEAMPRDGN